MRPIADWATLRAKIGSRPFVSSVFAEWLLSRIEKNENLIADLLEELGPSLGVEMKQRCEDVLMLGGTIRERGERKGLGGRPRKDRDQG